MTKKLIQSSHPGRKTFKKLYEQEKFIKLTQDQFFAESETVYTRSQTRLTIITHPTSGDHDVIAHPHRPLRGWQRQSADAITLKCAAQATENRERDLTFDFFDLKACKLYPTYKFQETMSLPARKAHKLLDLHVVRSSGQSILADCLTDDHLKNMVLSSSETATVNLQWQNKTNGKILPAERSSHSSTSVTKDKYKERTKIKTLRCDPHS